MNDAINFINIENLKFFGKVNASISHELKNILAIISETAGFLNDLTDLAKQGEDLKLSLLEGCSDSIAEDIQRGFTTIKQMNQFAHSVDVPIKETDLMELLQLTVKLSQFLSYASKVDINDNGKEIKPVLTCPFLLQNLIYQILIFAYKSIGLEEKLSIELNTEENDGTHIVLSSSSKQFFKEFPNEKIQKTANVLGASLNIIQDLKKLDIWVPYVSKEIVLLAKEMQFESQI